MKCICCHSAIVVKKFRKNKFEVFECQDCRFQFVDPLPSENELEDYYNSIQIDDDLTKRIQTSLDRIRNNPNSPKRDWFNKVLTAAKRFAGEDKMNILEIGSAYGYFIDHCNNNGHRAIGTEVSKDYANASHGLINGQVMYIPNGEYTRHFDNSYFDLIYLEHVFEHVLDPSTLLGQLRSLLKDSGAIIIVVPNHRSLLARISQKYYKWTCPPDHLYYHNLESLKFLADLKDLECITHWSGDYYHRSIYQFFSLDPFINLLYRQINKKLGWNLKNNYSYKYPRSLPDVINLFPYWMMYPLLSLFGQKFELGNELTIILKKKK